MTNVATENPTVVARLQAKADAMIADIGSGKPGPGVRPAGTVEGPVTLYPTQPARNTKKAAGKPIDWNSVKPGDVFASNSAPRVAGKPFTIRCAIERKSPRA